MEDTYPQIKIPESTTPVRHKDKVTCNSNRHTISTINCNTENSNTHIVKDFKKSDLGIHTMARAVEKQTSS